MQLNWTTFFIEIINFIILVWLLKRLLYIPVQNVIDQRKLAIQNKIEHANQLKLEAQTLAETYKNRLKQWSEEKEQKEKSLQQTLSEIKKKELDKLTLELKKQTEKNQSIQQHQLKKQQELASQAAFALATSFLSNLLKNFSSPEIEKNIITLFCQKISNIDIKQLQKFKSELGEDNKICIQTVYPLSDGQKIEITKKIQKLFAKTLDFSFEQNAELLAGITIQAGSICIKI